MWGGGVWGGGGGGVSSMAWWDAVPVVPAGRPVMRRGAASCVGVDTLWPMTPAPDYH